MPRMHLVSFGHFEWGVGGPEEIYSPFLMAII